MKLSVGTFNLNNLFSRWTFKAEVSADSNAIAVQEITAGATTTFRKYKGDLVKGKSAGDTERIAERIRRIDIDVLAVQEVEDIDTLKSFVKSHLDDMYPYVVLVEGNDQRLIDVALLSKLPIGGVTSWRFAVHPDRFEVPVFGRDLLQVEILNESRKKKLLTVFNNHLKSHYSPWWMNDDERAEEEARSNLRRQQQAEMVAQIVDAQTKTNERYIVVGDMNDPPSAAPLAPIAVDMGLVDGLATPKETRPAKDESDPADNPTSKAWTHRYKESGQAPRHELLDQIWMSPTLAGSLREAWIDRRRRHSGDGSDHDPAWIQIDV